MIKFLVGPKTCLFCTAPALIRVCFRCATFWLGGPATEDSAFLGIEDCCRVARFGVVAVAGVVVLRRKGRKSSIHTISLTHFLTREGGES